MTNENRDGGGAITQLEHAIGLRNDLKRMYPKLSLLRRELGILLDESAIRPPCGTADGTLSEFRWLQLRAIQWALRDLVVACSIDSWGPR